MSLRSPSQPSVMKTEKKATAHSARTAIVGITGARNTGIAQKMYGCLNMLCLSSLSARSFLNAEVIPECKRRAAAVKILQSEALRLIPGDKNQVTNALPRQILPVKLKKVFKSLKNRLALKMSCTG